MHTCIKKKTYHFRFNTKRGEMRVAKWERFYFGVEGLDNEVVGRDEDLSLEECFWTRFVSHERLKAEKFGTVGFPELPPPPRPNRGLKHVICKKEATFKKIYP